MRQAIPQALGDKRVLARRDVKIALYILLGLAVPFGFWALFERPTIEMPYIRNTVWAVAFANLSAWYALDKLRQYAKTRQLSYVMPVNFFTFGLAFLVIGMTRVPFSIPLMTLCFVFTLATSYVLTARTRITGRLNYVVPGGRVDDLPDENNYVTAQSLEELQMIVANGTGHIAIVGDLHFDHSPGWERLFASAALKGIPVYHYRQMLESQTGQVRINHLSENEFGSLIPNLPYMAAKRITDVAAVLALSPILILVLLLVAITIMLDSRGKILFVQERMGFREEPFQMIKFRTMHDRVVSEDKDQRREDSMTKDDDDRVTRVGRFLRKSRLDELPQVWNILRGDMSWIGPRPEAIDLSEWYESEIPFYSYRHIVRPGITGWAQVNQGHVTDLNAVNHKLRFDFYYVKHVSLWLDALIALKTVRVIFAGIGAR